MTPVEDLLAQATTIKNETVENNNSATRVGAWMEEVIPHLEQIANKAESGGSEKTLKTVDDEIVQLAGELSTLTEQPAGSFIYLSDLTSAFPTGNENVYLVKGNVKEVDTLTITGGATTSANFGVRLNNVTTYTSVLAGDSPDIVAQKIRSTVFVGWDVSGSGTTVIFTDKTSRTVSAPAIVNPPIPSGVTGVITRTIIGAAPDNKWYYWNGSAWVAGGIYRAILNTIEDEELETYKKTYLSAINELNDAKNEFDKTIELIEEINKPRYIELSTFTVSSDCPQNARTEIDITSQDGNILFGDFSIWGNTKKIPGVVEYDDGTYDTLLIKSFNTTSATFESEFTKTVVKACSLHDEILGQHLTDMGYLAMGDYVFNQPARTSFRHKLVKGITLQHHSRYSVVGNHITFNDNISNEVAFEIDAIGGYNPAYINIGTSSVQHYVLGSYILGLNNTITPQNGSGWEMPFTSEYNGFVEMYLGSNIDLAGSLCEVRFLKDNVIIKSVQFKGSVKRIIFEHEAGNYKIQVVALEQYANPILSGLFFFKKREIPGLLWDKNDRILFFTASWGAYPPNEENTELKPKQFDGTPSSGMSYFPMRFKDRFVEMGGRASNIFLATRGGQTSEWAKYWLPYAINEVKPTKIVFWFVINDYNSQDEYENNLPSNYDFDPNVMFASLRSDAGGVFASVNEERYKENIKWMADYCAGKGVIPVFITPPKIASNAQTQGLQRWFLEIYAQGIR